MNPIDFARLPERQPHQSCGAFVASWLDHMGLKSVSSYRVARAWVKYGVLDAAKVILGELGYERCDPGPNCIAVAAQSHGGMLVGIINEDGFFVTRSHGVLVISKPDIMAAWRLPCLKS